MFAIVVIGGMASVPGAILGAIYVFGMQYYMLPEWRFLATGVGLLLILLILPGGLGAGLAEARDGLLRWFARRHKILVPEPGRRPTRRCAAGDARRWPRPSPRPSSGPRSKRSLEMGR